MGLIKHPPLTVFEGHARGVLNYPSGLVKRTHSMNSNHCCQYFNQILQSCASHRIHKQHGRLQGVQEGHLPLKSHLRLPLPKLSHSFPLPEPQCNTGFQPPKENPADNHDKQSVVATFWSAHSSYRKVLFLLTSVGGVSDLFCQTTDCCFCLIVYLNQDQCFNHACFLSRGVTTCQKANTARTGINWREQAVFHDMHSKSWCTLTYLLCPRHPFLCSSQHAC